MKQSAHSLDYKTVDYFEQFDLAAVDFAIDCSSIVGSAVPFDPSGSCLYLYSYSADSWSFGSFDPSDPSAVVVVVVDTASDSFDSHLDCFVALDSFQSDSFASGFVPYFDPCPSPSGSSSYCFASCPCCPSAVAVDLG